MVGLFNVAILRTNRRQASGNLTNLIVELPNTLHIHLHLFSVDNRRQCLGTTGNCYQRDDKGARTYNSNVNRCKNRTSITLRLNYVEKISHHNNSTKGRVTSNT